MAGLSIVHCTESYPQLAPRPTLGDADGYNSSSLRPGPRLAYLDGLLCHLDALLPRLERVPIGGHVPGRRQLGGRQMTLAGAGRSHEHRNLPAGGHVTAAGRQRRPPQRAQLLSLEKVTELEPHQTDSSEGNH